MAYRVQPFHNHRTTDDLQSKNAQRADGVSRHGRQILAERVTSLPKTILGGGTAILIVECGVIVLESSSIEGKLPCLNERVVENVDPARLASAVRARLNSSSPLFAVAAALFAALAGIEFVLFYSS